MSDARGKVVTVLGPIEQIAPALDILERTGADPRRVIVSHGHVPRNIVPGLQRAGVPDEAIRQMLVENPPRLLPLTA